MNCSGEKTAGKNLLPYFFFNRIHHQVIYLLAYYVDVVNYGIVFPWNHLVKKPRREVSGAFSRTAKSFQPGLHSVKGVPFERIRTRAGNIGYRNRIIVIEYDRPGAVLQGNIHYDYRGIIDICPGMRIAVRYDCSVSRGV